MDEDYINPEDEFELMYADELDAMDDFNGKKCAKDINRLVLFVNRNRVS
jgi:hypothetical protein